MGASFYLDFCWSLVFHFVSIISGNTEEQEETRGDGTRERYEDRNLQEGEEKLKLKIKKEGKVSQREQREKGKKKKKTELKW